MTDVLVDVKDLITDNWTKSNTNEIAPFVELVTEVPKTDYLGNNRDIVYIYERSPYSQEPNGVGKKSKKYTHFVSCDFRTMVNRAHGWNGRTELIRIFDTNVLDQVLDVLEIFQITDLSDKRKNQYRFVVDVDIQKLHEIRNT